MTKLYICIAKAIVAGLLTNSAHMNQQRKRIIQILYIKSIKHVVQNE